MKFRKLIILLFITTAFFSCKRIVVDAGVVAFPKHEWYMQYRPVCDMRIDTSGNYLLYAIVRHSDKYAFNNLVTVLVIKDSSQKTIDSLTLNLPLVNKEAKWTGRKMDDLYDYEIQVKNMYLNKGICYFQWQQQMQQNPLQYILNVGIKLKKQ